MSVPVPIRCACPNSFARSIRSRVVPVPIRSPIGAIGATAIPPAEWPILKKQQSTGCTSLFIGAHAKAIIGMTVPEGRMLLMDLLEQATRPDRVSRHEWRTGDLVMWDNRTTLHRGQRWNISERRKLRRTTVLANES